MRLHFLFLLTTLSAGAYAAEQPPAMQPAPPPPPLDQNASEAQNDASAEEEPKVTIIKKSEQTVEEYRVGGRLYMIKITPKVGKPYYLVDDLGDGKFSRQEGLDSGVRPPRWVLKRF